MRRGRADTGRRDGFTLVELLAALAIASVIIVATGALVHNVALHFDMGTRRVSEGEHLILAIERLAADFSSARFVMRAGERSRTLAFIGEPASSEQPAKIIFVGAGAVAAKQNAEEVVGLTVEQDGDVTRLVRRRAPWFGPRTHFEELMLSDPVVLLEGKLLISFAFGRLTEDNAVAWSDTWKGQESLPRFVRLILRDPVTGADLLAGTDFVIRANASGSCAQSGSAMCFASASKAPGDPR
jgi:prepilin-type N-terminal cleavage/methylation domain-containing protein